MARSWGELLGEPNAAPASGEETEGRFFSRLRDSLSKSRRALTGEIVAAASFDPGNDADWERLEEALIAGDVGVRATAELVRRLEARGELADLNASLAEEVTALFGEPPILDLAHEPAVILVVGVNGTGKTTTIGKLGSRSTGARSSSQPPTRTGRPRRSSSRSGRSGPAPTSSAPSAGRTRQPLPTTPSRLR